MAAISAPSLLPVPLVPLPGVGLPVGFLNVGDVQPDAVLDQWLVHSHVAAWLLNRNLDKAELGVEFMLDLLAVLVVEVGTLSASLLSRGGTVLSVRYNATAIDSSRILKYF